MIVTRRRFFVDGGTRAKDNSMLIRFSPITAKS
jgi:hypothetical protein